MLYDGTITDYVGNKDISLMTKISDIQFRHQKDDEVDIDIAAAVIRNQKAIDQLKELEKLSRTPKEEVPLDAFNYCGYCGASMHPTEKVCSHCDCEIKTV
jgi:hypothetical protein